MNLQGAATQMRLCNHDRCIDPTNDLTPHQANTGDPLQVGKKKPAFYFKKAGKLVGPLTKGWDTL
jgi:hypothetical protein